MSGRQQRVMVQPIVRSSVLFRHNLNPDLSSMQNVIFKNLQQVRLQTHHHAV